MRWWMVIAVLAASMTVPMVSPGTAHACSCAYQPDGPRILEQVAHAEGVFTGTATEKSVDGDTAFYGFAVREVFTGDVDATTEVSTSIHAPSCGREFTVGTEYLVFASTYRTQGAPWSDGMCSASTPSTNTRTRDAAIEVFGQPRALTPAPDVTTDVADSVNDDDADGWLWAAGAGGVVVILALGAAWIRTRRSTGN